MKFYSLPSNVGEDINWCCDGDAGINEPYGQKSMRSGYFIR